MLCHQGLPGRARTVLTSGRDSTQPGLHTVPTLMPADCRPVPGRLRLIAGSPRFPLQSADCGFNSRPLPPGNLCVHHPHPRPCPPPGPAAHTRQPALPRRPPPAPVPAPPAAQVPAPSQAAAGDAPACDPTGFPAAPAERGPLPALWDLRGSQCHGAQMARRPLLVQDFLSKYLLNSIFPSLISAPQYSFRICRIVSRIVLWLKSFPIVLPIQYTVNSVTSYT